MIAVGWQYTDLNAEEMEGRMTAPYERVLTTLVDNIEHLESTGISAVPLRVVSGLQPLDAVIVDPADSLVTGTAVRIRE